MDNHPDTITLTAIQLKRIGDKAIVAIEIGGIWIDVISEHYAGNFCHTVEVGGMRECVRKLFPNTVAARRERDQSPKGGDPLGSVHVGPVSEGNSPDSDSSEIVP